jgi:unsaturated rhamnogalacturonyl hydrolase
MYMRKIFLWTLCLGLLSGMMGCHTGYQPREDALKWVKLEADAYMQQCDSSLTHYNDNWSYSTAFLARNYEDLYQQTHEQKYRDMFVDYMDFFVSDSAIWGYKIEEYNLERIQPARNLFAMYEITKEARYERAIAKFIEQLSTQPRNSEGGFWYRKNCPNQMWIETAYMACPFMAMYAATYDAPQWFDEAAAQILLLYEKARDPKSGLLFHGWDSTKSEAWSNPETGCSATVWGRAVGWFMAGIVDVLDYLPADHPSRAKLIEILQEVSAAVLAQQSSEYRLWYQVTDQADREGNYLEMSSSQLFIYSLAKGARMGYLPASYRDIAHEAYDCSVRLLTKWYYPDGSGILNVYYISGTCGLGKNGDEYRDGSYAYYTGVPMVSNDPKGTAPFMAAGLELLK